MIISLEMREGKDGYKCKDEKKMKDEKNEKE